MAVHGRILPVFAEQHDVHVLRVRNHEPGLG